MEELLTLKDLLVQGDFQGALMIVEELTEMSRNDIIKTIRSYAVILLLHLIKQQAENRTTRSWDVSIRNSVREIQRENKRRQAGGYYLTPEELWETLVEAYLNAIDQASLEVEEEAGEQGAGSKGDSSDGDSTAPERKPLVRSGGRKNMFRSAPRQGAGVISPRSLPPAPCLFVEEGRYEPEELEKLVNQEEILNRALGLILPGESS